MPQVWVSATLTPSWDGLIHVWVYREDKDCKVMRHTHRHEKSRDCEMEREEERERESMVLAWGNVLLEKLFNHLIRVQVGAHRRWKLKRHVTHTNEVMAKYEGVTTHSVLVCWGRLKIKLENTQVSIESRTWKLKHKTFGQNKYMHRYMYTNI